MQTKFYNIDDITFTIDKKIVRPQYPHEANVLKAITTSFANHEGISKFYNQDGTYKTEGIKKNAIQMFTDCLVNKHKSVFFTTNIEIREQQPRSINKIYADNPKYDLQGMSKMEVENENGIIDTVYIMSIYHALSCMTSFANSEDTKIIQDDYDYSLKPELEKALMRYIPNIYKIFQEHIINKGAYLTSAEKRILNDAECEYVNCEEVVPFFVANQLKRTKIAFTEVSARYTKAIVSKFGFFTPPKWRKQSQNKKQGSMENESVDEACFNRVPFIRSYQSICNNAIKWYDINIEAGIAKEMARFILPQSAYTMLHSVKTKGELARICSLRIKIEAQKEIRDYVEQNYYPYCCQRWGKENFDNLIDLWYRNF